MNPDLPLSTPVIQQPPSSPTRFFYNRSFNAEPVLHALQSVHFPMGNAEVCMDISPARILWLKGAVCDHPDLPPVRPKIAPQHKKVLHVTGALDELHYGQRKDMDNAEACINPLACAHLFVEERKSVADRPASKTDLRRQISRRLCHSHGIYPSQFVALASGNNSRFHNLSYAGSAALSKRRCARLKSVVREMY